MIFVVLSIARCELLHVDESYELSNIVDKVNGQNEGDILILYQAPSDIVLHFFPDQPNSRDQRRSDDTQQSDLRCGSRHVLFDNVESISKGVNYELENRVRALYETLRDVPHDQIPEEDQGQPRKDIEQWEDEYDKNGARKDVSAGVDAKLKDQERAGVIKQAPLIQKALDESLPPVEDRVPLPDFESVDPTNGEYDAVVQSDDALDGVQ
jgi:hypothetical protein